LACSSEGLRAAQRNAVTQPNSEQGYKDQSYSPSDEHHQNPNLGMESILGLWSP
jgi:hypothetical protein